MSNKSTLLCLAGGGVLTANAFILRAAVDDGGFSCGLAAGLAVLALLVPLAIAVARDWKRGETKMHELAVLAVLASCALGDLITSACVALFMNIALLIEGKTASGAKGSLEALARLTPGRARRIDADGQEAEVDPATLKIDDLVRALPGDTLHADGEVVRGRSSVDEASISGEALPVDKQEGSAVFAGTRNLSGMLDYRVRRAGEDTTLGRVRDLILKAESTRLPFIRLVDRYTRHYVPLVLCLCAAVLFFNRTEPDVSARFVSVMVACCPIALILSTPTAVVAALSAAARLGVLFKDVSHLEALARADAFVFDKTGTLTRGELQVALLKPLPGIDELSLLKAAAVAEAGSTHPVARAIRDLARQAKVSVPSPDSLHEEPGRGMLVTWKESEILAGNLAWMVDKGHQEEDFGHLAHQSAQAMSLLFVVQDGQPLGFLGLSDTLRDESKSCLEDLRAAGIRRTAIVSGDRHAVVSTIANGLDLDSAHGGCSPVDKVARINELKEQGLRVVFVGDGVNDGPALATADIGVAMGAAASDLAMESASVALMNNRLDRLPFLLRLARSMRLAILQNFLLGALIIGGGVVLGAMGLLSPVVAALLQVVGALAVVLNSARLFRQGEELREDG